MVIAHRGAFKKSKFPENSITALQHAIALQCAGLEFDVRMTKDEVLVVNHDADFHGLEIEKSNYSDLLQFNLSNGEKLPTLEAYIIAGLKNNKHTLLICEIKASKNSEHDQIATEKIIQLMKGLKAESKVIYISFGYAILQKILVLNPNANTQYLNGDKTPEVLKKDGIKGINYNFLVIKKNPEWITSAKKLGLQLNAWTVNNTDDLQWCIKNNFDFITTNEPELLFQLLK